MRVNRGERLDVYGTLALYGTVEGEGAVSRSVLASEANSTLARASLSDLRVHDLPSSGLPAAATADDLGLVAGAYGTTAPTVQSSDSKSASVTQYARWRVPLPESYLAASAITLQATVKTSTVASTSATLDAQVFEDDGVGGCGSDLCTTALQSVNNATETVYSFAVSGAGLEAGDVLDVRLTVAIVDSGTGTAVVVTLSKLELVGTVQG
jgi:hypothetical protein